MQKIQCVFLADTEKQCTLYNWSIRKCTFYAKNLRQM